MAAKIAILEDDGRRIADMRLCLSEVLPGIEPFFSANAQEMIQWLRDHLSETLFISLDHDLPVRSVDGSAIDCGTGRQVVDFLATLAPTCPVIVHSSNKDCALGMVCALEDSRWPNSQVHPSEDLIWIRES
jgi:hypothetical protein